MLRTDVVLAPQTVRVLVTVAPVFNILNILVLLNLTDVRSGLADFITQTAAALPAQTKRDNEIAAYLLDAIEPSNPEVDNFHAYIESLKQLNFSERVHRMMGGMCEKEFDGKITVETLLASKTLYVDTIVAHFQKKGEDVDAEMLGAVHDYLNKPQAAIDFLVAHLCLMWEKYLKDEWARVASTLEETVRVVNQLDLSDLTALEAVQAVTGRDMTGFIEETEDIEEVVFVPSVHCGPYITRFDISPRRIGLVFGARVPEGVPSQSVELSLRDLHIQLNALADDTRLHILELLTHHRELCSADFQQMLNISQSSASRHLRQLVASGFLDERRRDLNKYFSLNTRRFQETAAALKMMFARRG